MTRRVIAGWLLLQLHAHAQPAPPIDITGYWISVITQDWRLRMVTPARGDYLGIPLTPEAKKIADTWDPAKDEASGNHCKSYGAAGIMNLPERLHISWQDANTLRMDIDAGTQTRLFHLGNWTPAGIPALQGNSAASWVARRGPEIPPSTPKAKYLKSITTHILPGYLRKNGIPYSANAVLTEYYDVFQESTGETWMIVTTTVEDPLYLQNPLILTAQFKKQSDAAGWEPTPCSARW